MFRDFAGFANEVNKHLSWGAWRLQEEANANGLGTRNYTILYKGLNAGRLELRPQDFPYKTADSEIAADVKISHAHLFSYWRLHDFLLTLVLLICADTRVCSRKGGDGESSCRLSFGDNEKALIGLPIQHLHRGATLELFQSWRGERGKQSFLGGVWQNGWHRFGEQQILARESLAHLRGIRIQGYDFGGNP
jgi:hypothetical protein